MRVLHLTTEYPPVIYGGLGTAVGGWVNASARAGLDMGVLLVEGPLVVDAPAGRAPVYGAGGALGTGAPLRTVEGGEQAVVDGSGVRFFQASWATAAERGVRIARRWRPDVVHLHTAMVWPVARAIQEHTGLPLVYHVHSVDRAEYLLGEEPHPWLAHSRAQEEAIFSADRIIALSRDERDLMAEYYPPVRRRIRVVGNGIDDSPGAAAAVADRRSATRPPLVLYSGRLVERKGIRELLSAVPLVVEAAGDARFVLAGGPPPLTGDQVAAQWLAPDWEPHRHRVSFTGWLSPDALAAWYRAADILVVPSRYEPFGMVVLEGMLHGLAIVASDVGGPAEILEHPRTALLVPPRDVSGFAAAISRLLADAGLRRRLGEAAAGEVRRRWTWPRRVAAMRRVYAEVA